MVVPHSLGIRGCVAPLKSSPPKCSGECERKAEVGAALVPHVSTLDPSAWEAGMGEKHMERRLAAVLAADVVGYSRLMEANEERTLSALRQHRRDSLILHPRSTVGASSNYCRRQSARKDPVW